MKHLIWAAAAFSLMLLGDRASASDVTEHQWVRVSESGTVKGRVIVPRESSISAVRDAKVALLDQQGRYVSGPIESDATGRFVLSGLQPGVYTLLVQSSDAFACCAMHVVRPEVPINDEFEIAAGAVETSIVRQAMMRYLPPAVVTRVDFDPASNPLATDRAVVGHSVRISQVDDGLRGRLTRAGFNDNLSAQNANVLVFRDGVEVARTVTDQDGAFAIEQLEPGSYTILGSGEAGFGVMGLELVDPLTVRSVQQTSADGDTLVAQVAEVPSTFVMQVAPLPGPVTVLDDRLVEEREIGPAVPLDPGAGMMAEGGFAPMGGGGGAGGGIAGGGNLRGLALLGGAGAAIAIALADDDDTVVEPPVTSPAIPEAADDVAE